MKAFGIMVILFMTLAYCIAGTYMLVVKPIHELGGTITPVCVNGSCGVTINIPF